VAQDVIDETGKRGGARRLAGDGNAERRSSSSASARGVIMNGNTVQG